MRQWHKIEQIGIMHFEYKKWKKKRKKRIPAHSIYEITINKYTYSNCKLILNSEE